MFCPPCAQFYSEHPYDGTRHSGTNLISPIRCAFDTPTGEFTSENWNCETINRLRVFDYTDRELWNEDQNIACGRNGGWGFYVISYYKHHGATEGAWICDGKTMRVMTLADAEAIIKAGVECP